MKKIKTDSYFVTIYKGKNKTFVRRKKRKGLHAYPRTLSLKCISKYLKNTSIKYPKLIKNRFSYVDEELIESTENINTLSNLDIMNKVIDYIVQLNNINVKNKNITWNNNTEFLKFNINNLKKVLINKNPEKLKLYLNNLDHLIKKLDDSRKMCLIHGDIHRKNIISNNDKFYLIDWELATYGDLAYELATHFILMEYDNNEKELFIDKLCSRISIDKENLKNDINIYNEFELCRRKILGEISNKNK